MKLRSLLFPVLVLIISLPTYWSLLRPGYFPIHDDMQVMRVYEMEKCFSDGQFPCRWVPDMGYGYGYPQFNYYGPLPYYLMTFSHYLGLGYLDSTKYGFILALVLGNLAIYFLSKEVFGEVGGFLSSIVYTYSPYRASDIYSRGAMGESWAFVFLPIVFLYIYRLVRKPTLATSALLALSVAGLMVTHNVSTLVIFPFAGIFTIVALVVENKNSLSKYQISLKYFLLSGLLAVSAAASFFLPVIFEQKFAHVESMVGGYFDYRAHFVSFSQLFVSTFWGYGSSVIGPHDDLSFFYGPLMVFLIIITLLISVGRLTRNHQKQNSILVLSLITSGLIASFMVHEKSSFIWKVFPTLAFLQFPWRYLVASNFLFSFAIGSLVLGVTVKSARILVFSLIPFALLLSGAFFYPRTWINITDQEKLFGYSWDRQMTISIFDYLPKSSDFPPTKFAPIIAQSVGAKISFQNYSHQSNSFEFDAISTAPSTIVLPQLYFPGWEVFVDGQKTELSVTPNLGYITINKPVGNQHYKVILNNTPVRSLGNFLSLVGFATCLYLVLVKK